MAEKLKTGVVGAGVFGAFHAEKHAASQRAELAGIFDLDEARADAVAGRLGVRSYTDFEALLRVVDAIVIASPAPTHYSLARRALEAGRHVYVEKPLALSVAEADALIELARVNALVLQVGHQERFVLAALDLPYGRKEPARLEFARCGPPTGRGEDVSVVFDLMIHDLDIARMLGFERPSSVHASGDRHETVATLLFDDGRQCSFVASRRAEARRRRMIATYDDGVTEIDFASRTVTGPKAKLLQDPERAFLDPLGASVDAFFDSIIEGRATLVDGGAGRRALEWAVMIEESRDRATGAESRRLRLSA